MAQYKTGTVTVTNASNIVTGSGTDWLANAAVGNSFNISAEDAVYSITAVNSDTELELSVPYGGTSGSGLGYVVSKDYSPNYGLYEPDFYDSDWPILLKHGLVRKIDAALGTGGGGDPSSLPPFSSYTYGPTYTRYFGTSSSPTMDEAGLAGLTSEASAEFAGFYDFGIGGYKYIVYRSSIGLAVNFVDSNQMPVPFEDAKLLIVSGVNYNVHRSSHILNNNVSLVVY